MRFYILIVLILLVLPDLKGQKIFECLDYQKAVKNGTRSRDGNPGQRYWQNHADYKLDVQIDTVNKRLKGTADIIYYNNSFDTLESITLRLYQNKYVKGAQRNTQVAPDDLHEGVFIDYLIIDDFQYIFDNKPTIEAKVKKNATNLSVNINEHILPGDSAHLLIDWNFPVPSKTKSKRMGYFKDGAYFIGLWYPQIAVYDDVMGWDNQVPHMGIQDFYNDFNDYDVRIKVPEGYLVWATGELINEEDVYTKKVLDKLNLARQSDTVVNIITKEDYNHPLTKGNEWQFIATNVTDFGFGMANNYLWEGTSLPVQNSDERILADIIYHPSSTSFQGKSELARRCIKYYIEELPGYPFPFSHGSIFNGLAENTLAVEYPMIANMSTFSDDVFFKSMIAHKLFHNYFPFYMGINEKSCIWMDEGWAFYISKKFLPADFLPYPVAQIYSRFVGRSKDLPLIASSNYVIENNLPGQYFLKPYMAYELLEDLLGPETFKKALVEYISRWHGKHPTPYDFFYTVEDYTGKDLDWLWNPLFFEFGYPDLGIKTVEDGKVVIEKLGVIPVPVQVRIIYEDNNEQVINKNIEVWSDGKDDLFITLDPDNKIKKVVLGDPHIPDVNNDNNTHVVKRLESQNY